MDAHQDLKVVHRDSLKPFTFHHLSESTLSNVYEIAQAQFEKASKYIDLSDTLELILSQPKNELIVNFPVLMDNGKYELFKGYRIQHNNIMVHEITV